MRPAACCLGLLAAWLALLGWGLLAAAAGWGSLATKAATAAAAAHTRLPRPVHLFPSPGPRAGGCVKYTDKWAERAAALGAKEEWGDKWEENFKDGRGTKQVRLLWGWFGGEGGERRGR